MTQHACGSEPQNAHYVAVTMEDRTPWYELKMDQQIYETFKLTPFYGYACKDANGPKEYCKDMKVRYCCEKQLSATWGSWEAWATCSKTCGGGSQERIRNCQQNKLNRKNNYDDKCYGQQAFHTATTRERLTKQKQPCNVEYCPVDYQWSLWAAWGQCTITCGRGFKKTTRFCNPAIGGGMECPSRSENDLYEKSEECTKKDCEIFSWTVWTSWSSCSTTCGFGDKSRTRKCSSMQTLSIVSDDNCGPLMNSQPEKCVLQSCPVNGEWNAWGLWSFCNQGCITHPDASQPIITKAFRSRKHFCLGQAFGGLDCQTDSKYIYDSNTKSEEEQTDCVTPDSKPTDVQPTPWCPEHCIFTTWGAWSLCSHTCLPLSAQVQNYSRDRPMKSINYLRGESILPSRERIRILVKKARYGGECPEQMQNFDIDGSNNGTIIKQKQECTICKEHCLNGDNPKHETDVRKLTFLNYPSGDPKCVGYCPGKHNCLKINKKM